MQKHILFLTIFKDKLFVRKRMGQFCVVALPTDEAAVKRDKQVIPALI
jgi:hypothetical protein